MYNFLPEKTVYLRKALNKIYTKLSKEDNFRPKQVSINELLAQTWLTHLEKSINFYLASISLRSHIPISKNRAFYLYTYQERLDNVLKNVWHQFRKSGIILIKKFKIGEQKRMNEKVSFQNRSKTGKYYLASILSARNCTFTVMLRRGELYNLLVVNPKENTVKIQVKTTFGDEKMFYSEKSEREKNLQEDLFYAFIRKI